MAHKMTELDETYRPSPRRDFTEQYTIEQQIINEARMNIGNFPTMPVVKLCKFKHETDFPLFQNVVTERSPWIKVTREGGKKEYIQQSEDLRYLIKFSGHFYYTEDDIVPKVYTEKTKKKTKLALLPCSTHIEFMTNIEKWMKEALEKLPDQDPYIRLFKLSAHILEIAYWEKKFNRSLIKSREKYQELLYQVQNQIPFQCHQIWAFQERFYQMEREMATLKREVRKLSPKDEEEDEDEDRSFYCITQTRKDQMSQTEEPSSKRQKIEDNSQQQPTEQPGKK
jgi:hypothetical protein